jgi:hypothetical protein
LSRVVTPTVTKGRKFAFTASRTNAPFVTVRITNRDKKMGVLYKPLGHLTVFPQIAPFFLDAPVHTAASPCCAAPLLSDAPLLPTRAQRRLPMPASSAAPTSALPAHLRPRRNGPPRHAAPAVPPLLRGDPSLLSSAATARQPSSSAAASCSRYAAPPPPPTPPRACPPLRSPTDVHVPDGRPGRGGFRLADVSP